MFNVNLLLLRSVPPIICRAVIQEFNKRAHHSLSSVKCRLESQSPANNLRNLNVIYPCFNLIRQKSKSQRADDSDDEADFLDDDKSLSKDSKVMKFTTTSLRTDAVLKSALGVARNKIELLFYESKIRVNGRKITKKSIPVREDYEIDVIKSVSPKNPNHLYVARVEVLNITAKEDHISFTVRRFKNLLIENYEKDPYKPGTTENNE